MLEEVTLYILLISSSLFIAYGVFEIMKANSQKKHGLEIFGKVLNKRYIRSSDSPDHFVEFCYKDSNDKLYTKELGVDKGFYNQIEIGRAIKLIIDENNPNSVEIPNSLQNSQYWPFILMAAGIYGLYYFFLNIG